MLPELLFGDSNRSFDSWPWISSGKSVLLLSFFSGSGSCEILHLFFSFFFSDPMPVIYARSALPPVACSRWIASTTVLWWRFTTNLWESLEIASNSFAFRLCLLRWIRFSDEFNEFVCNCAELVLELMLGFMNVLEFFCEFVILICNCQERENWFCLCWCGAWMDLILTLCTIYSLPCVHLTQ